MQINLHQNDHQTPSQMGRTNRRPVTQLNEQYNVYILRNTKFHIIHRNLVLMLLKIFCNIIQSYKASLFCMKNAKRFFTMTIMKDAHFHSKYLSKVHFMNDSQNMMLCLNMSYFIVITILRQTTYYKIVCLYKWKTYK